MCGIVGIFDRSGRQAASEDGLRRMLALLRHRGPDEFGILLDREAGLGSARLSIIDLAGGSQPIANEDETLWIVFNGEVFNYLELRQNLRNRGHHFRTATDTEVILHLFEELGPRCLEKLNGQFAMAIWDVQRQQLFLARDRLGVRPLFYTEISDGLLLFASEIKSLFSDPRVSREFDPRGLVEVFTFWAAQTPNTVFRGIRELPPAHWLLTSKNSTVGGCYWKNQFAPDGNGLPERGVRDLVEEFRALLIDACRIRMRAEVPVGVYLSGGLDSSTIASVARRYTSKQLVTFSIAFEDKKFDESEFQREMSEWLGTDHHVVRASHSDVGRAFPDVVWHSETPLMRTAPAPMFLLSKLVREIGLKVVLTGEGADEFLAGYDLFKEAKIRRFWARQPESKSRRLLLHRLYRDIGGLAHTNASFLTAFFGEGLGDLASPWYSHAVRWRNNRRTLRFFDDGVLSPEAASFDALAAQLPDDFDCWPPLSQAQHLEITTFLSQYLLSSQCDRMGMAHSVEGRFPFLDTRLVEFCNGLRPCLKLRVLQEKYLLKLAAKPWLPETIRCRPKRPYRAPIQQSFFNENTSDSMLNLLSPEAIKMTGLFKPGVVEQLVGKIKCGAALSETDEMALVGILSTQLVDYQFVRYFRSSEPLPAGYSIKICRLKPAARNHEFQQKIPRP
jgi:asparagine synthase (glutamine-hydrolysing)